MASRVQRFCAEIGWSALERLINSFKATALNDDIIADCQELMQLDGVTQILAETFAAQGLKKASELLQYTPEALAGFLQQQRSFTATHTSSISSTSTSTAASSSSSSSSVQVTSGANAILEAAKLNSVISADMTIDEITRDEKMFRSLKSLMIIVLESAK